VRGPTPPAPEMLVDGRGGQTGEATTPQRRWDDQRWCHAGFPLTHRLGRPPSKSFIASRAVPEIGVVHAEMADPAQGGRSRAAHEPLIVEARGMPRADGSAIGTWSLGKPYARARESHSRWITLGPLTGLAGGGWRALRRPTLRLAGTQGA
jgi:hypothetical protein